jgi:two-component sensor histidine kinase
MSRIREGHAVIDMSETMQASATPPSAARARALAAGQKEAFQLAVNDAPIGDILNVLARTAQAQADDARAIILIVDAERFMLRFGAAAGLPESYTQAVNELHIGPDAPSCVKAAYTGQAVIASDVELDPLWQPYIELARAHRIGASWSCPICTAEGKVLGTLALYHEHPHEPGPGDLQPIELLADTAAVLIERHRAIEELRAERERQARELAVALRLQQISTLLIQEDDVDALHRKILEAARLIMGSDAASVQILDTDRGQLHMLASTGLHCESSAFWEWVSTGSGSSCGEALRTGKRVIVEDVEACAFAMGTADLDEYRRSSIRAVQSTPLVSRSGRPLGMISTHWRARHRPGEYELRMLDVLARQAAELIERRLAQESVQRESRAARAAEAHAEMLLHELNHRVKNTLATVQAIAVQTLQHTRSHETFEADFVSRLAALAHMHDLLVRSNWRGAALGELVDMELAPYRGIAAQRWSAAGPDVQLDARTALALGMAVHELTTNAAKYGALANDSGHIAIEWRVTHTGTGDVLHVAWSEHDGPAVVAPERRGFGSRLIERSLAYELSAQVNLQFDPSGVRCTLDIPLQPGAAPADVGRLA